MHLKIVLINDQKKGAYFFSAAGVILKKLLITYFKIELGWLLKEKKSLLECPNIFIFMYKMVVSAITKSTAVPFF